MKKLYSFPVIIVCNPEEYYQFKSISTINGETWARAHKLDELFNETTSEVKIYANYYILYNTTSYPSAYNIIP
jgi:hypothetical protein